MIDEISQALKIIDSKSATERTALMNTICDRIIDRKDPTKTSLEEYIFALHGFSWNKPHDIPERVIAQKYDLMLTKHPTYDKGTPTARIRPTGDNKNHPIGNAEPILFGRLERLIYTVDLIDDGNNSPKYLGNFCLRLTDVRTAQSNAGKSLCRELSDDIQPISLAPELMHIPSLDLVLSSATRLSDSHIAHNIEELSEVAYSWSEILAFSDLHGLKGPNLLGHVVVAMQDWQN